MYNNITYIVLAIIKNITKKAVVLYWSYVRYLFIYFKGPFKYTHVDKIKITSQ